MTQDIAESDTTVAHWGRIVLSKLKGEAEASYSDEGSLSLESIDEGRPIVRLNGECGKVNLHFEDAAEMQEIAEWFQKQAELVDGWNQRQQEIIEEAEEKENPNEWLRQKRISVDDWWSDRS